MKMARLFITGMGGLAGRALAKYALNKKYIVGGTIHNNFPSELNKITNKNLTKYYPVDLNNLSQVKKILQDFRPDVIIHFAGRSLGRLDSDVTNPLIYAENLAIAKNITQSTKNLPNNPRFVLSSGCLVYNNISTSNFISEIPIEKLPMVNRKKKPYLASRIEQERLLLKEKKLNYSIVRPTQFTGPGKITGVLEWYIADQISRILTGHQKSIKVRNKKAEVDILDVRDVIRAYLIVAERGVKGEIYHVSTGSVATVEEVVKVFLEVVGLNTTKFPIESTETEETIYFRYSPNKLKKLGWKPHFTLKESLSSYWRYFKNKGFGDNV